jgi:hypothetical protein
VVIVLLFRVFAERYELGSLLVNDLFF